MITENDVEDMFNEPRKSGLYKYYITLRPVSIGTQPKGMVDYTNYDNRKSIKEKMVWGELYYKRKLTEKEMNDYDLIDDED